MRILSLFSGPVVLFTRGKKKKLHEALTGKFWSKSDLYVQRLAFGGYDVAIQKPSQEAPCK